MKQQREAAKQALAENCQKDSLHGEDERRGEKARRKDRKDVAAEQARKVRRIEGCGQHKRREHIGVEQEAHDEDGNGGYARDEEPAIGNGQRGEHEYVEQIGKEEVPLEHSDDAHGHKRIDHEEEVVVDLEPIGRRIGVEWTAGRPADEGVVDRPEIERDHEAGNAGGHSDQDEASLGVAVGRIRFVVEEALQKMSYQQRELAALRRMHGAERGLRVQRKCLGLRHHEEPLEFLTHCQVALPPPSPAPECGYPAAPPVAQRRSPDSAGSLVWSDRKAQRQPGRGLWQ